MAESRAKWTDFIPDTGLRIAEVTDQGDDLYTPGIDALLNVRKVTGAQENFGGKTPFGEVKQFDDGDDVPTVSRDKTYTTKVVWKNYGGAVEVTKNQIQDQDFASELDVMKDLSRSINQAIDKSGMQLFNGGFATTVRVNGFDLTWYNDGNPQYSTVHATVVAGASTQSNASSTGITLGHDNLEVARVAMTLQQTDNGLPLSLVGKDTLVVPVNLEKTAKETIMSTLTPETANNAINVYRGAIDMVSTQFLDNTNGGSDTQWFLNKRAHSKLYHGSRQEKTLENEVNIRNKVLTATIDARWRNYSLDWRGTWASKGDLAAYAS